MPTSSSSLRASYPHDFVTLEIGQAAFRVKANAFFDTHDPSILHDLMVTGASVPNLETPLVLQIPRSEAKPYAGIVNWLEERRLPKELSNNTLSLLAEEADFLCMDRLGLEASTLYPLRAHLERLPVRSAERAVATAEYADTLDALGDIGGSAEWFRQAQKQMPQGSSCLVSHYEGKLQDPSEEGRAYLRLASLAFCPITHEFVDNEPSDVFLDLFRALSKRGDDAIALFYMTGLLRSVLVMTDELATYTTLALCNALTANPHSTTAQLSCLLLCDLLPRRETLARKIGHLTGGTKGRLPTLSEREAETRHAALRLTCFERMYAAVSPATRNHSLAQLARAEHHYNQQIGARSSSFIALLNAAEKYFETRSRAGESGDNFAIRDVTAVVRRALVDGACSDVGLGREALARASNFCMRSASDKGLEFSLQKFILLVIEAYPVINGIGQNRSFSRNERQLIRAELQLRSGKANGNSGELVKTAQQSASDLGIVVSYLTALCMVNRNLPTESKLLEQLLLHLARSPGASSTAFYLQGVLAPTMSALSFSIDSQRPGSLAYYLQCQQAQKWPTEFEDQCSRRLEEIRSFLRTNPSDLAALREGAWCAYWTSRYEEAVALLDQEALFFADPMCARPVRALCLHALGDIAQARQYLLTHQDYLEGSLAHEAPLCRYIMHLCLEHLLPTREALYAVVDSALTYHDEHNLLEQEAFLAHAKLLRRRLVAAGEATS